MSEQVSSLKVMLHGERIGTITYLGNDRTIFSFAESYVYDESRATLSLAFKDRMGELLTDFRPTQTQLIPFFSNLLPEGPMRAYLARRAGVKPVREFFLMQALGKDLAGAIEIESVDGATPPSEPGHDPEEGENFTGPIRFSLAGVQLKFSAVQKANRSLTIPATGQGGSWIVKLPAQSHEGVPENEYSMMWLAQRLGMDVPEIKLIPIDQIENIPRGIETYGSQVFAIKRFDRVGMSSVHIEDFAQIFGVYPKDKYEKGNIRSIAQVLRAEASSEDIEELIRRLVFNALIGNGDMHLKNWSVIYRDKRKASIAPAYDFVSTVPYIPNDSAALKVSRSKKFSEFTFDELAHLAAKARLPEKLVLDTAKETLSLFQEIWPIEKKHLPMHSAVTDAIDNHLRTMPFARGRVWV